MNPKAKNTPNAAKARGGSRDLATAVSRIGREPAAQEYADAYRQHYGLPSGTGVSNFDALADGGFQRVLESGNKDWAVFLRDVLLKFDTAAEPAALTRTEDLATQSDESLRTMLHSQEAGA